VRKGDAKIIVLSGEAGKGGEFGGTL